MLHLRSQCRTSKEQHVIDPEQRPTGERPDSVTHWMKMLGLILLMTPVMLIGIILCASLWLIPLGVPLILLSAWPAYRCDTKYEVSLRSWQDRDHFQ